MKLYNTLTRSLEEFRPLAPPAVTMYVCGPTVYDEPHIGHARSAYTFDVLRRYLTYKRFDVTFVRNVTDVDDKIIEKARQSVTGHPGPPVARAGAGTSQVTSDLNEKCREVSEKYLASYHATMDWLGIERPDIEPKATEHVVPEMTDFISKLLISGNAYEAKGPACALPAGGAGRDVYFSVRKFPGYGKLSNRTLDDLKAGARVEPGEHKEDPLDFALWKAAKPGEPSWKSPWGDGRPGWHIECSVMSTKYLGEAFDIHGGGLDLIFPHHENEIAQAQALEKPFAKYWVHNGLLTVNGEKMSKSLGNFVTVGQALKACDEDSNVLKIFFLSGHYRSPLNYMLASVAASGQRYDSYCLLTKQAHALKRLSPEIEQFVTPVAEAEEPKQAFLSALDDDLNTPQALSALDGMRSLAWRLLDEVQEHGPGQSIEDKKRTGRFLSVVRALEEHGKLLGLSFPAERSAGQKVQELREAYIAARNRKDFNASDSLRKKLNEEGFNVQDTGGTSIIIPKQ